MPSYIKKGRFFMTKYLVISSILLFFYTGETRAPVPAKVKI